MQTVTFKGRDLQVDELTVAQLESAMQRAGEDSAGGQVSAIDNCFISDFVTEYMLELATGLDAAELRTVRPSELVPLVTAFRAENAVFLQGLAANVAPTGGQARTR